MRFEISDAKISSAFVIPEVFFSWPRIKGTLFPANRGHGVTQRDELGSWENAYLTGECGHTG